MSGIFLIDNLNKNFYMNPPRWWHTIQMYSEGFSFYDDRGCIEHPQSCSIIIAVKFCFHDISLLNKKKKKKILSENKIKTWIEMWVKNSIWIWVLISPR